MSAPRFLIKQLGQIDYQTCFERMQAFTLARKDQNQPNELWCVEHPPVYTQGVAGKPEHILNASDIPIVQVNRGGQVTYHGPGQAVVYTLIDIERARINVKELVALIEQAMLNFLTDVGVGASRKEDAPGVYIAGAKIGSIGLRVQHGCTYHGLSFNVEMDLTPFSGINPCGYAGMPVTQLADYGVGMSVAQVQNALCQHLEALMPKLGA